MGIVGRIGKRTRGLSPADYGIFPKGDLQRMTPKPQKPFYATSPKGARFEPAMPLQMGPRKTIAPRTTSERVSQRRMESRAEARAAARKSRRQREIKKSRRENTEHNLRTSKGPAKRRKKARF